MRRLIRAFDAFLRRCYGVYEFSQEPGCILRIAPGRAPHTLHLPDGEVQAGEAVLFLHLWNERLPHMATSGPDLGWAVRLVRPFVRSLHLVATEMGTDPRWAEVRAVGGASALLEPGSQSSGERVMRRLGFEVMPYRCQLGRFGEFWENFYSWWIMWTYNAVSLRQRRLIRLRRMEIWMSAAELLERYG